MAWPISRFMICGVPAATRLSEMGYNPDWIEKTLNHKVRGVRGIYNRAEYCMHRRKMLQDWADILDALQL